MNKLFQKKYRIASARLSGFDYSQDGYYFVTICTSSRKNFFGEIKNQQMFLSPIGRIARQCWQEIPQHFPFVQLDQFVVMPDHVHGIVVIDNWSGGNENIGTDRDANIGTDRDAKFCVSTSTGNKFGPQSKNLASVIRGFKVGVKKYATLNKIPFAWQPRFFDRIIRDDAEFNRVQDYISTNVANWEKDADKEAVNLYE
ncbi:MAG: transposase [Patescibacteria group bacterium]